MKVMAQNRKAQQAARKCQVCNNLTKNPSGLCHLHESRKGAGERAGHDASMISSYAESPRGNVGGAHASPDAPESIQKICNTSKSELVKEWMSDQLIVDYHVKNYEGQMLDALNAGKVDISESRPLKDIKKDLKKYAAELDYVTFDDETEVLGITEYGDTEPSDDWDENQFWDKYSDTMSEVSSRCRKRAVDNMAEIVRNPDLYEQELDRREMWEDEGGYSSGSATYDHQLEWSISS